MNNTQQGPWAKGVINTVPPEGVPQDALLRAENVDIDQLGYVSSRNAFHILDDSALLDASREFIVIGGTPIDTRSGSIVIGKRYTKLNDSLVGIDDSGLIYAPPPNNDLAEGDARYLVELPGGGYVEAWNGRLLVARGTSLLYSEPFNYASYDPVRNFVSFSQQITWLAPLQEGVFVGTRTAVYFLAGRAPEQWQLTRVDGASWEGAGGTIPTAASTVLSKRGNVSFVACWFTPRGFVFGYGDGAVVAPQEDRLTNLPVMSGRLIHFNNRLWVLPL